MGSLEDTEQMAAQRKLKLKDQNGDRRDKNVLNELL